MTGYEKILWTGAAGKQRSSWIDNDAASVTSVAETKEILKALRKGMPSTGS